MAKENAVKENIITRSGLIEIEKELEYLKVEKRKEVSEKIKEARGYGDLSENSEYDEAKNEQAEVEAKIARLEAVLATSKVIEDDEVSTKAVTIGSRVKIHDFDFDEDIEYTIVGSAEVDILKNKISDDCALGAALIGGKKGNTVSYKAPDGNEYKVKILSITR